MGFVIVSCYYNIYIYVLNFRVFDWINILFLLKYIYYSFIGIKLRLYIFFKKDWCGKNKNIKREDEGERRCEVERKCDMWM